MIARADIWEIARQPGLLTAKQLRVLELRELHAFSWRQIAYMTNSDASTIRGHYNAAVRKLHDHIAQHENEVAL